jgi:hypothetical protein
MPREALSAAFDGAASGDSYKHIWDGTGAVGSEFYGSVGSKQSFTESFRLISERTGEEAEVSRFI